MSVVRKSFYFPSLISQNFTLEIAISSNIHTREKTGRSSLSELGLGNRVLRYSTFSIPNSLFTITSSIPLCELIKTDQIKLGIVMLRLIYAFESSKYLNIIIGKLLKVTFSIGNFVIYIIFRGMSGFYL